MRATPVTYDMQQNPLANIMNYLGKVRSHGMTQVAQQSTHDRLLNAADPDRSIRQLQAALADGGNHGRVLGQRIVGAGT